MAAKMGRPKKEAPEEGVVEEVISNSIDNFFERLLAPVAALEKMKRREYLTPEEVEIVFGLKATTLANKRLKAEGPEYVKDGDRILYRQQAIKAYLDAKTVRTRL